MKKMMKMILKHKLNRIKGKGGFTLIEVLVTLVITIIIIAAAGTFLISGTNLLNKATESANAEEIATTAADFIRDRILLATNISVVVSDVPPILAEDESLIYVGNEDGSETSHGGYLFFSRAEDTRTESVNVYGLDYYGNKTITLDYSVTLTSGQPKVFTIKVTTNDKDGNAVYHSTKTFQLPNSDMSKEPVASASHLGASERFYILMSDPAGPLPNTIEANGSSKTPTEWEVTATGYYKIEAWGADGGGTAGGSGGYSSGIVWLAEGTTVYLSAGEAGGTYSSSGSPYVTFPSTEPFGGGGKIATTNGIGSTGGGGSDFRIITNDLNHRVLVAGGGGGSGRDGTSAGGNGGGTTGTAADNSASSFAFGLGGAQTAGGALSGGIQTGAHGGSTRSAESGAFGIGGLGVSNQTAGNTSGGGGGGGGGWFGGSGGVVNGGGGGSGYVLTETSYRPGGYFSDHADYYCIEPINVTVSDTDFVERPTTDMTGKNIGKNGYVRITPAE